MKIKSIFLICALMTLLCNATYAFDPDFSISGYGAAGYRFYDRNFLNEANQETYYEGKVQFDFDISKNIDAQLDFRANSLRNTVDFREFSIKLKYFDMFNVKFGQIKKPFGYEYLINREDLVSIDRSYMQSQVEELGYGGRNLSLMVYTKYDPGDSTDLPVSYYLSFFKDNSMSSGGAAKFIYHFGKFGAGISWLLQNRGGAPSVTTQGVGIELVHESSKLNYGMEAYYTEDPYEKARFKTALKDETTFSGGLRLFGSYRIDIDSSVLNDIEPLLNCSYYARKIEESGNHVINIIAGVNFYLSKNAIIRADADIMLKKNIYNKHYTTKESKLVLEFLVRL